MILPRIAVLATSTAVLAAAGIAGTVAPVQATSRLGNATVAVSSDMFGPRVVEVGLEGVVTWNFTSTGPHTSTSDQGFWNSDADRAGEDFSEAFSSAGRFAYHSRTGPDMHGAVEVPVSETGSPEHGYVLRWSTIPGGRRTTFDVQVRTSGGTWQALAEQTRADSASFDPDLAGAYQVRARTDRGSDRAHRSGWSPTVTVTVS